MNIKGNVLWITRTAVLTALLVTAQFVTAPLGNQFITGSIVNLILVVAMLTCGPATGFTVAVISPVCASLAGVGPAFPPMVPFIALGNVTFMAVWFALGKINKLSLGKPGLRYAFAGALTVLIAAVVKFLTLYFGIVKIAVPYILRLNEKQSAVLSFAFSYPQIITAIIGGTIALLVVPVVQKAIAKRG
jgi:hypothetical protein